MSFNFIKRNVVLLADVYFYLLNLNNSISILLIEKVATVSLFI